MDNHGGRIEFPKQNKWQHYVDSRRLEITCGEAPRKTNIPAGSLRAVMVFYMTFLMKRILKGGTTMRKISYNKLWKLLIDKNMNKNDLKAAANISSASTAKLGKGTNVTTDVLLKICNALDCDLEDIMETVRE